ncbi:Follistatin- protein 1 [Ilyodon furcidens]|uniref:Follistatin- protein 1 n=1 Tax=Ilyodon furcidens TaxID=33524 RepID=A0ABV0TC15_9TELE
MSLASELQSKSKVCANVFCGAGRECTVNEKGEPSCLCIESCKPHKRSVCGSNGKTYRNHCELHRDACLSGLKIQVAHDGHCREKKTDQSAASPGELVFVCTLHVYWLPSKECVKSFL